MLPVVQQGLWSMRVFSVQRAFHRTQQRGPRKRVLTQTSGEQRVKNQFAKNDDSIGTDGVK